MKQLVLQNKKIFYNTCGKGKPVMLVHGFAEDNSIWDYQVEKLQEEFYLITPDLPGCGKSEHNEDWSCIEDYAAIIKTIADAEIKGSEKYEGGKNGFTLVGHSMGGYITLAFAERYPEALNGFGLFHSTAYTDDDAKKQSRRKGIEFIKSNGAIPFLKTTIPNLFSEKTKKERPQLVEGLIELSLDFSAGSLIQYYEAMIQRPDRTSVLRSFEQPVFFIMGKNDGAVPLRSTLPQCYLPAVSDICILQHSGHMGMWEEKEKSTIFLRDFLRRL
ncbi:MAG: alpha/beta hydrolase [Ginsengibacter sp.]